MPKALQNLSTLILTALFLLFKSVPGMADSTSLRLAAYYDLKMLLCDQTAYQWRGNEDPKPVATGVVQVGVGKSASYVLTVDGRLLALEGNTRQLLDDVSWFSAGRTGIFAARTNGTLIYLSSSDSSSTATRAEEPKPIAESVIAASIGDSANYFITNDGTLFVQGAARRGQYGNGSLKPTDEFVPVATDGAAVKAHTGHAILLKQDGTVMGTGGNIYGPLGRHGLGDKAVYWAPIFQGAKAIATGSSHSLAIIRDGSLWHWGRNIGLKPSKVLDNVTAAAADSSGSVAILDDNSVWQWRRGQQPQPHFVCPGTNEESK